MSEEFEFMKSVEVDHTKAPKEYKYLSVDVSKTASSFVIIKVAKDLDVTFRDLTTKYRHIVDSECETIASYEWDDDNYTYEVLGMAEVTEEYAKDFFRGEGVATIG